MGKEQLKRGTLFPPRVVDTVINAVKGNSVLAKLSSKKPLPFNGKDIFTFSFDGEVDVVGEGEKKSHGGIKYTSQSVKPIKIEYGARVTDEFLYATEEEKIRLIKDFAEGFARKAAKGFDLMAMHGINPRSGQASNVINDNHFDSKVEQKVETRELTDPIGLLETAVALVQGEDNTVSGMALSPEITSSIGKLNVNGVRSYPEFMFGATPDNLNGINIGVNNTVSHGEGKKDYAIVGDFENMFNWGYAKEIATKVIEYGDPDNTGRDLAGYNEVYIRAELFLGWAILDPKSFARITKAE